MRAYVLSRGSRSEVVGVVRSPSDFKDGDVLFADNLDLRSSYVYIPKASAVITSSAGLLSHVAILAREYGIPAVRLNDAHDLIGKKVRIKILDGGAEVEVVE